MKWRLALTYVTIWSHEFRVKINLALPLTSNMKTNKENHNLKENSQLHNLLFSVDIILFLIVCQALAL